MMSNDVRNAVYRLYPNKEQKGGCCIPWMSHVTCTTHSSAAVRYSSDSDSIPVIYGFE